MIKSQSYFAAYDDVDSTITLHTLVFRYSIEVLDQFPWPVSLHLHAFVHLLISCLESFGHTRGYKVEPREDLSPLLSMTRDTSIETSVRRPQRLRSYRDALAKLVWCTCRLRFRSRNKAEGRLLAKREQG